MGSEREAIGSNLPWGKKLQLGHQERQDTGAVGETIEFHTHRPGLGQPKISQGLSIVNTNKAPEGKKEEKKIAESDVTGWLRRRPSRRMMSSIRMS